MDRGLGKALRWRVPLWLRRGPGKYGGGVLLLLPTTFFLPLELLGTLETRAQVISLLVWLSVLGFSLVVRGAAGLRDPAAVWLYQKGYDLGNAALEDWVLDMGLFSSFALWVAAWGGVASFFHQEPNPLAFLSLWLLGSSVALLTHSLTFFFSAFGASRGTDMVAVLAFLSVLLPPFTMNAPGWVSTLGDWILPSYQSTIVLSGAARNGAAAEAFGALFHILVYSGVVLWLGYRRISRWRPLV